MTGEKLEQQLGAPDRPGIILCVALAAFLFQFEAFFIQISLPDMQREWGASQGEVARVVTFYLVGTMMSLFPAGWVGRAIGFGRTFILGTLIAFAAVSVCGLLDSLRLVWVARWLQGVGIGLMVSSGYLLIPMWVEKTRWGFGFAAISQGAGLGMVLGLPAGGLVAHFLSWRWLFFCQIPLILGIILLGVRSLPPDCLTFLQEADGARPLRGSLFKSKGFLYALMALFVFHATSSGVRFLVPFYVESVQGMGSLGSSLVMLPYALAFVLSARFAGKASDRYGSGPLLSFSYGISILGLLIFVSSSGWSSLGSVVTMVVMLGVSTGVFSPSNNRQLMSEVPVTRVLDMGPVLPLAINLGTWFGIVLFQDLFQWAALGGGAKVVPEVLGSLDPGGAVPYLWCSSIAGLFFLGLLGIHGSLKFDRSQASGDR